MKTYDERHPFCMCWGEGKFRWTGDPARGSFAPKEQRKRGRRR